MAVQSVLQEAMLRTGYYGHSRLALHAPNFSWQASLLKFHQHFFVIAADLMGPDNIQRLNPALHITTTGIRSCKGGQGASETAVSQTHGPAQVGVG